MDLNDKRIMVDTDIKKLPMTLKQAMLIALGALDLAYGISPPYNINSEDVAERAAFVFQHYIMEVDGEL